VSEPAASRVILQVILLAILLAVVGAARDFLL